MGAPEAATLGCAATALAGDAVAAAGCAAVFAGGTLAAVATLACVAPPGLAAAVATAPVPGESLAVATARGGSPMVDDWWVGLAGERPGDVAAGRKNQCGPYLRFRAFETLVVVAL